MLFFCAKDCLGLAVAFISFAQPICEFDSIVFMGAFATHLHLIQKLAEKICVVPLFNL